MPSSFATPNHDPIMTQFDRLVAFACYVLLFLGVFTFGVSSVVALALALAHGRDSHPIIRSHYRHQVRIFWLGAFCIAGALLAGLAGSGTWLIALFNAVEKATGMTDQALGVGLVRRRNAGRLCDPRPLWRRLDAVAVAVRLFETCGQSGNRPHPSGIVRREPQCPKRPSLPSPPFGHVVFAVKIGSGGWFVKRQ